jgi:squalene-associated FAD-dependent desaturase
MQASHRLAGDPRDAQDRVMTASAVPQSIARAPAPAPRVIVIGGGLAGMAAAVALESAGAAVTLIESRKSLGGRAGSFEDPQTGEPLDNCQHVLLGCCTNLIDFYTRIGVADKIHYHRAIHFRDEHGKRHDLWGVKHWPAPLNLGPSMVVFNALTLAERISAASAMLAMLRLGKTGRLQLGDTPFGEWLDEHRQPASLVQKFYDPIIVSGLNEDTRKASAAYAIQIFQDAMLANERGYVLGMPACTLGELYATLPCRDVRLGTRATGLTFARNTVTGVTLQSGETIPAGAVVLATNHHSLSKWIPSDLAAGDTRFAKLDRIESVPILGVHLWFDRPILRESHAAFINGPLQWVFRKDSTGRSLHGVISAARDWLDRPKDEMLALFEHQIRETFVEARDAKLERGQIVIEKRATFSPLPGIDRLRPPQAPPPGGIRNLFLAGDYTLTGWPATMEGAVRAGYLAADALLAQQIPPAAETRSFLVHDLPVQWPARMLGLED